MQIIAVDQDKEAYEVGLPFIKKAGVEHKIDFVQSNALLFLSDLLKKVSSIIYSYFKLGTLASLAL